MKTAALAPPVPRKDQNLGLIWTERVEEEDPRFAFCLSERPPWEGEPACPAPYRLPKRELVRGMAGALLVHALVVAAQFLVPFMFPKSPALPSFVTVSFVSVADLKGKPAATGGSAGEEEGGHNGGEPSCALKNAVDAAQRTSMEFSEAPPPGEKAQEDEPPAAEPPPAPVPEPVAKAVPAEKPKKVQPVRPKPAKQDRPRQGRNTPPAPSASRSASVEPAGTAAPPSRTAEPAMGNPSAEGEGTGDGGGKGNGAGAGGREGPGAGNGGTGEYQLSAVDVPPKIISRVEPEYPQDARRRCISGKVVIRFLVDSSGRVLNPSVLDAKPEGIFDRCVLEALRKWRFKPGIYQGRPVSTWMVLPIHFQLTG